MGKAGNPNWKKGVSGNPSGRPKGQSFATLCKNVEEKYGAAQHPDYPNATMDELCVAILFENVREGERWAVQDYLDRKLGKPNQSLDIDSTNTNYNLTEEDLPDEALLAIIASTDEEEGGAEGS